jgi:hypothetical protein
MLCEKHGFFIYISKHQLITFLLSPDSILFAGVGKKLFREATKMISGKAVLPAKNGVRRRRKSGGRP